MPSPCMYSRIRHQGATLLEVLVATAIAALIFSVLFAVYFAVIQTTGRQAEGRGSAAAVEALDMLARDFMCAMIPSGITNLPLELTEATNALPGALCRFYTAEPFSAELGPQHYAARAVQVQLLPGPSSDAYILERITRPLPGAADSAGVVRETWAPLYAMNLTAYDGENWSNQWASSDLPQAIRLTLQYGAGPNQTYIMTVPIPAGIPFGLTNVSNTTPASHALH